MLNVNMIRSIGKCLKYGGELRMHSTTITVNLSTTHKPTHPHTPSPPINAHNQTGRDRERERERDRQKRGEKYPADLKTSLCTYHSLDISVCT